jgi:hypothetical protein
MEIGDGHALPSALPPMALSGLFEPFSNFLFSTTAIKPSNTCGAA